MNEDWLNKALYILAIILGLAGIGMTVYKLLGHSPTIEEMLLVFQAATITLLISHIGHTSKFEGKTTADIGYIKRDLHELKAEVKDVRKILSKKA